MTGYSGTPLAKKLGIKNNSKIRIVNQPAHYFELFTDFPPDVRVVRDRRSKKDVVHYFTTSFEKFKSEIASLKQEIAENGAIWISWPKKASGMTTDLNENDVRSVALKNGLVDVKVCAIDEVWSGLKLVIRLKDRT